MVANNNFIETLASYVDTSTDDIKLPQALKIAETVIEDETGIIIGNKLVQETVFVFDNYISLKKRPVNKINKIILNGLELETLNVNIIDAFNGKIFIEDLNVFNTFYKIEYEAGFNYQLTAELQECYLIIAIDIYYQLDKVKQGVESINTPDGLIKFMNDFSILTKKCISRMKRTW